MTYLKTILIAFVFVLCVGCPEDSTNNPTDEVCFTRDVESVIDAGCAKSGCHDSVTKAGGITLIGYADISKQEELVEVLTSTESDERMPPSPWVKLTDDQIGTITKWVEQGSQNTTCDPLTIPDTTSITYTDHIKNIVDIHCIGCHYFQGAGTGPDLSTYEKVKDETQHGNLLPCIKHTSGYLPMPLGRTRVSEHDVQIFEAWTKFYKE